MNARQAVSSNGNRQSMGKEPDPQVVAKAERRRFSAEYKRRIVAEADGCTQRGEIGALLRREGLYSSHLDKWRKQREQDNLAGSNRQKRGRKPDPQATEIARLQRGGLGWGYSADCAKSTEKSVGCANRHCPPHRRASAAPN